MSIPSIITHGVMGGDFTYASGLWHVSTLGAHPYGDVKVLFT